MSGEPIFGQPNGYFETDRERQIEETGIEWMRRAEQAEATVARLTAEVQRLEAELDAYITTPARAVKKGPHVSRVYKGAWDVERGKP